MVLTRAARVEYCALSFSNSYEYFTSSAVISRPLTGGRLWNFTPCRSLKIHVEGLTISQLVASVFRIIGVVWTSGKYQVASHSVSVSQTRASSGRYPMTVGSNARTAAGNCNTPPWRGGEGGTGGWAGNRASSSLMNAGAA